MLYSPFPGPMLASRLLLLTWLSADQHGLANVGDHELVSVEHLALNENLVGQSIEDLDV